MFYSLHSEQTALTRAFLKGNDGHLLSTLSLPHSRIHLGENYTPAHPHLLMDSLIAASLTYHLYSLTHLPPHAVSSIDSLTIFIHLLALLHSFTSTPILTLHSRTHTPGTHIHSHTRQLEDIHGVTFRWDVPIELVLASVPRDGVQLVTLKVVVTVQFHRLARHLVGRDGDRL